jgi:hypothetical protein
VRAFWRQWFAAILRWSAEETGFQQTQELPKVVHMGNRGCLKIRGKTGRRKGKNREKTGGARGRKIQEGRMSEFFAMKTEYIIKSTDGCLVFNPLMISWSK